MCPICVIVVPQTLGMILSGCILIYTIPFTFFVPQFVDIPPHPVTLYWAPSSALVLFLKISSIPSLSCWYCNFNIFLMVFDGFGPIFGGQTNPPKTLPWFGEAGALVSQAWLPAVEKAWAARNVFDWCPKMGCFLSATHVFYMGFINKNLGWIYKNRRLSQQH